MWRIVNSAGQYWSIGKGWVYFEGAATLYEECDDMLLPAGGSWEPAWDIADDDPRLQTRATGQQPLRNGGQS